MSRQALTDPAGQPMWLLALLERLADLAAGGASEPLEPPQPADEGVTALFGAIELLRQQVAAANDRADQHAAQLAATEARYNMLAQNSTDIVWERDADGVVVWVSPSVEGVLGWAPEELIGTAAPDIVHPDDLAVARTYLAGLLSGVPVPVIETRIVNSAGDYRWMALHARPKIGADGSVTGTIAGLRDIDEQVLAREQVHAERERLRATLDSLFDPSTLLDPVRDDTGTIVDFTYVDANAAACGYLQTDRTRLIGTTLLDLNPGLAGTGLRDVYAQVVESGEPLVLDDQPYDFEQTGSQRFYDIRGVQVDGRFSLTWRDVTERRLVADALADSERRFRLVAECANDAVLLVDLAGVVEWASPSVRHVLGYDPVDMEGANATDLIHPEDLKQLRKVRSRAAHGEIAVGFELRMLTSDGDYRWMAGSTGPAIDADGAIVGRITTVRDVDDQVQARQDLAEASERLSRSNRDLEEFAFVASHDLQEPVRVVVSFTELLVKRNPDLDEKSMDYLRRAQAASLRMVALIDDLLAYSRLSTAPREFVEVSTSEVVAGALADLSNRIADAEATITVGSLPNVHGDPGQLGQLFGNLIGNALKYSGAEPAVIDITAMRVSDSQHVWEFCVKDAGIGFDPKFAERIFMIFQRLHARNEYSGTGIGLALCKRVVERHGGRIWADSAPGVGTTIRFTLEETH